MKIIFLTKRFYPFLGGVEKHCFEVGRELVIRKRGYEVVIITEGQKGLKEAEVFNEIKIYRIPITTTERLKKFQIWAWLFKNRRLIQEADIVHCHDIFYWYLPFKFIYPNKKVYTTFHGWEGIYPPTFKSKFLRKLSERLSDNNICVGDYIKKWYGTHTDNITYGGIKTHDFSKFTPLKRSKKLKITFIGRLEEDTGIKIYLSALEILRKKGIVFESIFLGDGNLRERAKKIGKVLGFIEKVGGYLGESDLVFSSGYLSMFESLLYSKTNFAVYDNRLKEDYLRMSPFAKYIVIESDPKKLAQKVIDYMNGKLKIDLEGGYNWARTQTWDKVTDLYIKLWSGKSN